MQAHKLCFNVELNIINDGSELIGSCFVHNREGGRVYLYFLAEVPLIPLLHIPMDLLFPLFHREFSYFESCVFQT